MKETTRERLVELLDEHEYAGISYGNAAHPDTDDRAQITEAQRKIVELFESLLPHEEEDTAHEPMSTEPPEDPNRWEDVWFWRNKARNE